MEIISSNIEKIQSSIRDIPDYPKKGILFKDITPVLKDKELFRLCIDEFCKRLEEIDFDYVVGIESRGFILGSAIAYKMKKGFVPVRKKGKLPYKTIKKEYELEYGSAILEMHIDAIEKNSKVVIVDDLLATGGTADATIKLVEQLGGIVCAVVFLVELEFLNGKNKLGNNNVLSLIKY